MVPLIILLVILCDLRRTRIRRARVVVRADRGCDPVADRLPDRRRGAGMGRRRWYGRWWSPVTPRKRTLANRVRMPDAIRHRWHYAW